MQINTNTNSPNYTALPKKYMKVDNYLIRGPRPSICDLIELKKEGVNQVYDFRHKCVRGFKFIEKIACKIMGIEYKRVPFSYLKGELPTAQDFERIAASVKTNGEKGGKTLFHCNSGSHRTAHMSAFYDLTKGEPISKVQRKQNPYTYKYNVNDVIKRHLFVKKYFNRRLQDEHTWNPILNLFHRFNNRVIAGTKRAHESFVNILKSEKEFNIDCQ